MKFVLLCVFLCLVCACQGYFGGKKRYDCDRHGETQDIGPTKPCSCRELRGLCPRNVHPVCDTNGKKYFNRCLLCQVNGNGIEADPYGFSKILYQPCNSPPRR